MTEQEKLAQFEQKVSEAITGTLEKNVPNMIEKAVTEKVEATIKEKGLDKIDLKHGNFPGHAADDDKTTAKERSALFVKSIFKNDFATLAKEFQTNKTMIEDVDSQGGFTVPDQLLNEILRIQANVGLIRKLSRNIPMSSKRLSFLKKATGVSIAWEGEIEETVENSPTLAKVVLEAKRASGLSLFSNDLIADTTANILQFVQTEFGEALASAEDFQGLLGVGTPFTGVLNEPLVTQVIAAAGNTTVAALTLPDWRKLSTPLPAVELSGAVHVMHPTVWEAAQSIQEGGQTVVAFQQTPVVSGEVKDGLLVPVGTIWSRPVYLSDLMPSVADIDAVPGNQVSILGNFRNFAFGNRRGLTMSMSSDATVVINGVRVNTFTSDSKAMKIDERVALQIAQEEGFTVLTTAAA